MKKLRVCLSLFLTMLKIGAFTFGGGLAMISLLENEFVSRRKWISKDEFLDMTVLAESTPGPIAINAATYIGYRQVGFWGSLAATVGVVTPSFLIMFVISLFLDRFLSLTLVAYAFQGIRAAVVYLIMSAGLKMLKNKSNRNIFSIIMLSATFITMLLLSFFAISFSSIFYILIGGLIGITVSFFTSLKNKEGSV